MFNQRLKLARKAAGLSLRGLCDKIDKLVSAQAISNYERGVDMPGSRVLIALAEALNVSEEYLLGEHEMELEDVDFRKKSATTKKEIAQVQAQVIRRLEKYLTIEEVLGLSSVAWDKPREAPYPVHELSRVDWVANKLRDQWDLGDDPIPDMVELLEERGIKILAVVLPDKVGGLTAKVRTNRQVLPVVVVNNKHNGDRQRFTLAHELGHMVMVVDASIKDEDAANRFAGAFLMPADVIWAEVGRHRHDIGWAELFDLKSLFKTSVQAITYRLKDLGIIGEHTFVHYFREFNRRGWRKPPYAEPMPVAQEKTKRFERLCYRALAEDYVSEAKAAELLELPVREINKRMDEPPITNAGTGI